VVNSAVQKTRFFQKWSILQCRKPVFFKSSQFCNAENPFFQKWSILQCRKPVFSKVVNSAMQKTRFFQKSI
jgi:hypothetical protein